MAAKKSRKILVGERASPSSARLPARLRQAETLVEEKNEWHYALACHRCRVPKRRAANCARPAGKLKHTQHLFSVERKLRTIFIRAPVFHGALDVGGLHAVLRRFLRQRDEFSVGRKT
jgi:hypothetical protein